MYNRGSKRSAKRTTTTTARRKNKYRPQMIEALECRQLLTTLYGGGAGRAATYIYTTAGATPPTPADAQITIYGDVVAEFIFVDGTGAVVNRPVTFNGPGGVNDGTGGSIVADPGLDLFAIYVAKSDINSFISIEAIGTSDPFGSVTSITINPANPKQTTVTASSGSGQLRLGALSGGQTGEAVIKTDINGAAIGVRPAGLDDLPEDPTNDLSAGLRVANGQDLGKFLFDGEVFGKVHIDGSMNLFYAGWLLTGDARGANEPTSPATGFRSGASGLPVSLADDFITPQDAALGANGHIVPRQNFYVGGDLQNLVSDGAIGWDSTFGTARDDLGPFFLSGVDIYVRGRVGQIHGNEGNTATVTVLNLDPAVAGFTRPVVYQEELEGYNRVSGSGVVGDISLGFPNTPRSDFSGGVLYGPRTGRGVVPTTNDRFDSFQMLGTFNSPRGNDIIDLLGTVDPAAGLDVDPIDFYGVPLMAGQTISLQLLETFGNGNLHIGVFDPDGRLIASDYTNLTTPNGSVTATRFVPFQITADRPGIYRVAVSEGGDPDFVGTPTSRNFEQYELIIGKVGPLGLGGVSVVNQKTSGALVAPGDARMVDLYPAQNQVEVDRGDFGGIYISAQFNTNAGRQFAPTTTPPPGGFNFKQVFGTVYVANGNLRAMDATKLGVGTLTEDTFPTGPDFNVPNGSIGLLQARDPDGVMQLNPSVRANFQDTLATATVPTTPTTPTPFTPAELSIGGSYQVINAAGRFYGAVAAKAGMGTLRAGTIDGFSSDHQTFIYLDTDNQGFDGKSDLIDVAGSIDGPALIHGPGGNFRYMRVGGAVGTDPFFGSSISRTVYDYGQSVSFTDDSGSTINLSPVGLPTPNPVFNPQDPTTGPVMIRPQLSTQVYPVRSGGVIVMDVQSTGSLAVNTSGGAVNATAEISRIEVHGSGAAPVRTTRGVGRNATTTIKPAFTSTALKNDLSVVITGSAITDVAYIVGMVPESAGNFYLSTDPPTLRSGESNFGNLTLVSNNTGGEILEVHAANLGTLRSTGTIGVTRTTTIAGNSLNFLTPLALGSSYGGRDTDMPIQPTGTVVGSAFPFNGQTYGIAINGDIAVIQANMGLGNIVSTGIIGQIVANADQRNVGVQHEGIEAPIYATGTTIGSGQVVSGVPDGSILAIDIGEGMGSAGSGDFARTGIFAANNIGSIVGDRGADIRGDIYWGFQLGSLTLRNGSLIDANLVQSDIDNIASIRESASAGSLGIVSTGGIETNLGSINIGGNGGIIGTLLMSLTMNSINVGGFGILNSHIETSFSGFINTITVGGYGIRNTIINGGNTIGTINVTGNGKKLSTNKVSTDVRQSEFVRADPQFGFGFDPYSGRALTGINDIHAALGTSQASPAVPGVTATGVVEDSRITGQRDLGSIRAQIFRGDPAYNRIAFGNSIGTIQSRGVINGLTVVTGRINNFNPAAGVGNLHMRISGLLDHLTINGNLNKGSEIEAIGPNGRIGTVNIKRSLNGTIHATQSIGTVTIGKNLNGSLIIDALAKGGTALQLLKVGGTISNGSLDIGSAHNIANVGQIIVGKSLGMAEGDSLFISGTLDRLQVGGSLNANIRVGRGIGTLQARRIGGNVTTGGDLKNLLILKKGLHGNLKVRNHLQNANIHGVIDGDITANNGIGTITAGSVVAGNTIESKFGSIGTLRINGDLDGNVIVDGQIGQIIASGDLGDGTTPMTITADHLGLLDVGGSIRNGVTIHIRGPIDVLIIDENVDAGAVIQASAVHRNQIHGEVFGSLLIG